MQGPQGPRVGACMHSMADTSADGRAPSPRLPARRKDFEAAQYHYEAVTKHADADFVHLPDTHFNLAVLAVLTVQPEDNHGQAFARATKHYGAGCEARKRLRRWLVSASFDVSQKLAKALLAKFGKAVAAVAAQEAERKKDD